MFFFPNPPCVCVSTGIKPALERKKRLHRTTDCTKVVHLASVKATPNGKVPRRQTQAKATAVNPTLSVSIGVGESGGPRDACAKPQSARSHLPRYRHRAWSPPGCALCEPSPSHEPPPRQESSRIQSEKTRARSVARSFAFASVPRAQNSQRKQL